MEISYKAVVQLRLMLGIMSKKCSRSYTESGLVGFDGRVVIPKG